MESVTEPIFNEKEDDGAYIRSSTTTRSQIDYTSMSLDEIIHLQQGSSRNNVSENGGGMRYGADDTAGRNPRLTPVSVLKMLAEDGKLIEMEAKELEFGTTPRVADFRAHRWRIIWTHRGIQGVAEAPRKIMATQVAAFDLLEKLRIQHPNYNTPACSIPPGCLVNPFLFMLIEDECSKAGIPPPEYQLKECVDMRGKKEYISFCLIDEEVFVGKSYDPLYAKRFSAKRAYEALSKTEYPDDPIVRGESCFQGASYNTVESEANHVYYAYDNAMKRIRLSRPGSQSSAASSVGLVSPPPGAVPPPIILPKKYNHDVQSYVPKRRCSETPSAPSAEPEGMVTTNRDDDVFNVLEIEHPNKYGELSDDDEEDYGVPAVEDF